MRFVVMAGGFWEYLYRPRQNRLCARQSQP